MKEEGLTLTKGESQRDQAWATSDLGGWGRDSREDGRRCEEGSGGWWWRSTGEGQVTLNWQEQEQSQGRALSQIGPTWFKNQGQPQSKNEPDQKGISSQQPPTIKMPTSLENVRRSLGGSGAKMLLLKGCFSACLLITSMALPRGWPDPWAERGPAALELQRRWEHSTQWKIITFHTRLLALTWNSKIKRSFFSPKSFLPLEANMQMPRERS